MCLLTIRIERHLVLENDNCPEGKQTSSLERGEIPITPVTPFFTERCCPASNFLLGHFCVLGYFLGILFTKNALQGVLQGISAERTRVNAHISPHIAKPPISCQNHSNNWLCGVCSTIESYSSIAFLTKTNRSFRIGAMKMPFYRTALFGRKSAWYHIRQAFRSRRLRFPETLYRHHGQDQEESDDGDV